MLNSINSKLVLLVLVSCTVFFGCSKKDDEMAKADLSAASDILQYVPADSPYVFASLAPLPDDVMDKLEPSIDRILSSYETLLQELVVAAREKAEEEGEDAEQLTKAAAVVGELSSLMSVDGLRGAGFERDSLAALYGNGLLPVLRMEVSDGKLFEAELARLEEAAGEKMDVARIAGNPVRYVDADQLKVVIAVLDTQVAVAMAPLEFGDEQLAGLLGFTEPARSIADSGKLQAIADKYAFNKYMLGYFDVEAFARTITGDAQGLDADLFELLGDSNELSDVCRAEIRAMAGIAPRIVMGYTEISTEQFDSQAVFELRSDIASGLRNVPAAVPGLGGDMGGLLSFGMSLDVMALREFIEAQLDVLEKDPYECEEFAGIQQGVAQARANLAQPVMPMIYDFRGFAAVIENVEGLNMAAQTPPTSVDGRFLLAMNNAPAFLSFGAMMSPELAALNLQPDSKPVLVDVPQAQMLGGAVYAALSEDALALSVGDDIEAQLGPMLAAEASEEGVFFNFSMDAERYYTFTGEAIAQAGKDDENPMSPAFNAAMQDVMLAFADVYDRMSIDMRFTEDGLVMDSSVKLAK